jgi:hypothetical protein
MREGPKNHRDVAAARRARERDGPYAKIVFYDKDTGREIGGEILEGISDIVKPVSRLFEKANQTTARRMRLQVIPNWENKNHFLYEAWRNIAEAEVRSFLNDELRSALPGEDYRAFQQHGLSLNDASRRAVCNAIDQFISDGLFLYGPKILLLPEVLQRIADWVLTEKEGQRLCKKFGDDLVRLARLYRGEAKAPLTWWARSRHAIVAEVKALCGLLRAKPSKKTNPSKGELISTVLSMMKQDESRFPNLIRVSDAFVAFLFSNITSLRTLLAQGITPAEFVGDLIQWATNYTPESARQTISRLNRPGS